MMKKAIIALDYSPMDEFVIRNSKSILDHFEISELTFIHVVPKYLQVNDLGVKDVKLGVEPIDKLVSKLIMEKIEKFYSSVNQKYKINCQILVGSPYTQLINYMKLNPTDLFIAGKKHKSKGSGITARRIAHHVACNVLFITEDSCDNIKKIGVPIDFSDNSLRALNHAISMASDNTSIQPVHVVSYPYSDDYLCHVFDTKYKSMFRIAAEREYDKLIKKNKLNKSKLADIKFIEDTDSSISKHLKEYFEAEGTDLVIMGARGHNALDVILYGSVTEKFVDYNDSFPTLIIR